jgi:hypothetical protein
MTMDEHHRDVVSELHALVDAALDDARRDAVSEALVVAEAEVLAQGQHHLTVAQGPIDDEDSADVFDDLVACVDRRFWQRPDTVIPGARHLPVTVDGPDVDATLAELADALHRLASTSRLLASAWPV